MKSIERKNVTFFYSLSSVSAKLSIDTIESCGSEITGTKILECHKKTANNFTTLAPSTGIPTKTYIISCT